VGAHAPVGGAQGSARRRRRVKRNAIMRRLCPRRLIRFAARLLAVTCAVAFCAPPAHALHRLTSVNYGDGQTQGYTFDAMGNRLTKTDNVAGNDTYSYNAANMLLSRNGGAYTNDAKGNTLTGGGRTNTWDGQNRLTQCVFGGTTTPAGLATDLALMVHGVERAGTVHLPGVAIAVGSAFAYGLLVLGFIVATMTIEGQ
jgi:YD repeat-containing protein